MKRLATAMQWDARLQVRYGLYIAGAFALVVWLILLLLIEEAWRPALVPSFLLLNVTVNTFYFVAALILFEKDENVLEGLVVSPLRGWEYMASKVVTLTALSFVENMAITLFAVGLDFNFGWLILGFVFMAFQFTLFGVVAVARYANINSFLLPSGVWMILLSLPPMALLDVVPKELFWVVPTMGPFVLLQEAVLPFIWSDGEVYLAIGLSVFWCVVAMLWALRAFNRHIVRRGGR